MSIETVLRKHQIGYEPRAYPAYVCLCGWDGAIDDNGGPDDGLNDSADGAIAHVAATPNSSNIAKSRGITVRAPRIAGVYVPAGGCLSRTPQ